MTNRITIALICASVFAQTPAEPRFDVVSIREVSPNAPPTMREFGFTPVLPGGRYINSRAVLHTMISFVYGVENAQQLAGLPKWAEEASYSIAAKPADGFPVLSTAENREQVRLRMRALLAERFHLRLHTEDRQETIYLLGIAKGGPKIKEVEAPLRPAKQPPVQLVSSDRDGRMLGQKGTIDWITRALASSLKHPVVDRTGLKGYYDFDVKWTAPEGSTPGEGLTADGIGLLVGMLPDQLGLRLTKATGAVRYWVVDHVEPPSGN